MILSRRVFIRGCLLSMLATSNVSCRAQGGAPSQPEFCRGVNYVSWTTGDYPWATSWIPQTFRDSQGIVKAEITTERPFKGRGSLELALDLSSGSASNSKGEVFVDLRYIPRYVAGSAVTIRRGEDGKPLGVDLSGMTLAAVVYCPASVAGDRSQPCGIQLFCKSMTRTKDGKETWRDFYGNWHNVYPTDKNWFTEPKLGHVMADEWSLVSLTVPRPGAVEKPAYGLADPDFDPTSIALVGLKFAMNDQASGRISGKMWVDNFGWRAITTDAGQPFDFSAADHPRDFEIWEHFVAADAPPLAWPGKAATFGKQGLLKCGTGGAIFDFEDTENPVDLLTKGGFNAVAVVNTEYMAGPNATAITPVVGKTHTEEEMAALIKACHAKGLAVVLKPHVNVSDDTWQGEIGPQASAGDEEKRRWVEAWFASYTNFVVRSAKLAQTHKIAMLVVGTEFKSLNGGAYRKQWADVIRQVREVYSGELIYAANWDDYENVCFWDLVDVIGIDAYFPTSAERAPSYADLLKGWSNTTYGGKQRNWVGELEVWQKKVGKNITFTEIGYRSTDYAARAPSEFKESRPVNLRLQADCYRAVVEAFKGKPWFKGVFFWLWSPRQDVGGAFDTDFTPQHKPAEKVFLGGAG